MALRLVLTTGHGLSFEDEDEDDDEDEGEYDSAGEAISPGSRT